MDDKNTFQTQRRNVILASLAIILYVHGGGEITEDTRIGFIPIKLTEPKILIYAAVIMFVYFCYRFLICGGNKCIFDYKVLKQKIFKRIPGGLNTYLEKKAVCNITDQEERKSVKIKDIQFELSNPSSLRYRLETNKGKQTYTYQLQVRKHPTIFIKGFWWSLRHDTDLSDYLVPFGLAIYAWTIIIVPYVGNFLQYVQSFLTSSSP